MLRFIATAGRDYVDEMAAALASPACDIASGGFAGWRNNGRMETSCTFASLLSRHALRISCALAVACGGSVAPPTVDLQTPAPPTAVAEPPEAPPPSLPPTPVVAAPVDATFPIPVGRGETALAMDSTHLYFASNDAGDREYVSRVGRRGGAAERLSERPVSYGVPLELAVTDGAVLLRSQSTLLRFPKGAAAPLTLDASYELEGIGGPSAVAHVVATGARAFFTSAGGLFEAVDGQAPRALDALQGLSENERRSATLAAHDGAVFAVTTDFTYTPMPAAWATVTRTTGGHAAATRIKLDGRRGKVAVSAAGGKLYVVWADGIDVLDASTLARLGGPPAPMDNAGVHAAHASSRGLFFIERQFPDPYGKLDGLRLTMSAAPGGPTSPLSEGGAPRLGVSLAVDETHVYWVRRDTAAGFDARGVIERVAR